MMSSWKDQLKTSLRTDTTLTKKWRSQSEKKKSLILRSLKSRRSMFRWRRRLRLKSTLRSLMMS